MLPFQTHHSSILPCPTYMYTLTHCEKTALHGGSAGAAASLVKPRERVERDAALEAARARAAERTLRGARALALLVALLRVGPELESHHRQSIAQHRHAQATGGCKMHKLKLVLATMTHI